MAFDERVAGRVREAMASRAAAEEKRMFGGIAFMVEGHMCVGVNDQDLMLRVGPEAAEEALGKTGARRMDFTGRPLKGYLYVSPDGYDDEADLGSWLDMALAFVRTLPPKG
jgi:TfoX/Sxy family transcriptional regulator of competence genes